jgi:hypothetical protein
MAGCQICDIVYRGLMLNFPACQDDPSTWMVDFSLSHQPLLVSIQRGSRGEKAYQRETFDFFVEEGLSFSLCVVRRVVFDTVV